MKFTLNNNFTLIILLILISLLFLSSCKDKKEICEEYPNECDNLTGEWEIELFTVNDIDSLPQFITKNVFCNTYKIEYTYNNYYFIGIDCNGNSPSHEYWGHWIYGGTNNFLWFYLFTTDAEIFTAEYSWNIEALSSDKIWLKSNFNNNSYELHFKTK